MSSKNHTRNLLKFSLYSTTVVLPKKILADFGWEAGDKVTITAHTKPDTLLIQRAQSQVAKPTLHKPIQSRSDSLSQRSYEATPKKLLETHQSDEIIPIPEID